LFDNNRKVLAHAFAANSVSFRNDCRRKGAEGCNHRDGTGAFNHIWRD